MIDYMPHSGRRPHVWKCLKARYRQILTEHGWGFRGAYASKMIRHEEYMMTMLREDGEYRYSLIRRKGDFWAFISKEARQKEVEETRKRFHVVQTEADTKDIREIENDLFASMAKVRTQPMAPDLPEGDHDDND